MNEEAYSALTRVTEALTEFDLLEDLKGDVMILCKAIGLTDKQMHSEFPELFEEAETDNE